MANKAKERTSSGVSAVKNNKEVNLGLSEQQDPFIGADSFLMRSFTFTMISFYACAI